MVNLHTSDEELIPASQTTPHVTNIIHSVLREDMPFDDFFAL